jgi:hypothetical protein
MRRSAWRPNITPPFGDSANLAGRRRRGDRRRCALATIGRAIGSSNGRPRPRRACVGDGGAVWGKLTELFETTLGIHRPPFWACRYNYKRAAAKTNELLLLLPLHEFLKQRLGLFGRRLSCLGRCSRCRSDNGEFRGGAFL